MVDLIVVAIEPNLRRAQTTCDKTRRKMKQTKNVHHLVFTLGTY